MAVDKVVAKADFAAGVGPRLRSVVAAIQRLLQRLLPRRLIPDHLVSLPGGAETGGGGRSISSLATHFQINNLGDDFRKVEESNFSCNLEHNLNQVKDEFFGGPNRKQQRQKSSCSGRCQTHNVVQSKRHRTHRTHNAIAVGKIRQ